MEIIILLAVLLFSVIVHEVMHGIVAEKFGDYTARDAGRITLNPIPHIDPFGSILLPAVLIMSGSPIVLGAAKPVPVNFFNLRPRRLGMIMVSLAGPLSNFALVLIFTLIIKLGLVNAFSNEVLILGILMNTILGIFNLVPIPPLDGGKVILSLISEEWMEKILRYEQFGFILVILLVLSGLLGGVFTGVIETWFNLAGLPISDLIQVSNKYF